ncbi:MAG: MMPL family transporter [Ilumatobacteraceae bacterium]
MLARLGRWCFRHRWLTIIIWLVALIGGSGVANGAMGGGAFETRFSIPDSQSLRALDLLKAAFPDSDTITDAQIVFESPNGFDDAEVRDGIDMFLDSIVAGVDGVRVTSPYDDPTLISESGTIAYAVVGLPSGESQGDQERVGTDIREVGDATIESGTLPSDLVIEYGGDPFVSFELPESEVVGLLAAVIILVLAFGSVLAMGLPIGTALVGLGTGIAIITILSHVMEMPEFVTQIGAMIGIGVGIDYALFIVTRFREGLRANLSPEEATVDAIDTAGRAVLFAGITVMISLLGMYMMGMKFIYGLAIGGSATVGVMVLAALTLLPALLSLVGHRIDVTTRAALWSLIAFASLSLFGVIFLGTINLLLVGLLVAVVIMALSFVVRSWRTPIKHRAPKPKDQQFWFRWSRFVQNRPWTSFLGGLGVLLILTIPLFGMRLALSDNGNRAEWQTARRAYDLLAKGFGPGFNGPLQLVAEVPADTPETVLTDISAAVSADPDVVFVSPPVPAPGNLIIWKVVQRESPQAEGTAELVHRLRDDVLPPAIGDSGVVVNVGGFTAIGVDLSDYFGRRVFLFVGAVLVLSFLLLMAVFRSLLVPLKAVIMNLLSIGAAYGIVVAIFQWGWGADLIGIGAAGPIDPFIPMMLFAIVFGLSMDYEVFLLSRMKEEFDRTGDNATAVADGLAATARVITAAALIMVAVFGSFVAGDDRTVKLFGMGLAVAVLIDATLVRMVLVPATMELLGARNWWIPKWLDRVLPKIDVEGHSHIADKQTA